MAEKFVSPFIGGETGGVGEDDDLTQLPIPDDAMLFNDSLDEEEMDPKAFLDLADTASLPTQCAAGEPTEQENIDQPPGEDQQDLNDSLNVEEANEAAMLPAGGGDVQGEAESEAVAVSVEADSCRKVSATSGINSSPGSEKACGSSSPEGQSSLGEARSSPQEKSSAAVAGTTCKVKPSFGKKKKGVCPSTVTQKTSASPSKDCKQPPSQNNSPQKSTSDGVSIATTSKDESMDNDLASPAPKSSSTSEKKAKGNDKKVGQEQRKKAKEEKEGEVAAKKQSKEQSKLEKEKKKAERERQREEKRLELERKKAEREQKKIEREAKKIEREQKKAEKQAMASKKKQQSEGTETKDTSSKEDSGEEDDRSKDTDLAKATSDADDVPSGPTTTDTTDDNHCSNEAQQVQDDPVEAPNDSQVDQDVADMVDAGSSKPEIHEDQQMDGDDTPFHGKSSGELTSQERSSKTEDTKKTSASKPTSAAKKVKPSFGKKKGSTQPSPSLSSKESSETLNQDGMDSSEGSTSHVTKENVEKSDSSSVTGAGVQKGQKKMEKETKKAERERQREEKRLELERKKAEREQKKMEREAKKMEREQKKAEKQAMASKKKPSNAEDSSCKESANESKGTVAKDVGQESKVSVETESVLVNSEAEEDKNSDKENIHPSPKAMSVSDDNIIDDKIPVVMISPLAIPHCETKGDDITKEKSAKKFTPPKCKKNTNNDAGKKQRKKRETKADVEKSSDGRKPRSSGKGRKRKASSADSEPEAKRSTEANYHGPVWVQCEISSCKKWRLLKDCEDPADVPNSWTCSMNPDPDHNSCSAEEEQWSDLGDSQEFVESPYIPGSVVWSKMDGYPWWPAMIEEDPNEETYYEMGHRDNPIPVKYHVVFFDTPVCRGWVSSLHTLPFTGNNNPNKDAHVNISQKHRRSLTEGKKQATRALSLSAKERLESFGFAKRFHGSRKRRREEDSPEVIRSQSKRRRSRVRERPLSSSPEKTRETEDVRTDHKQVLEDENLLSQHVREE